MQLQMIFFRKHIIIKSLDPLRAKKTLIRKQLGHTAVCAYRGICDKQNEYGSLFKNNYIELLTQKHALVIMVLI